MAKLKLTPELQEEICRYIASGITKKSASSAAGIDESTFFKWMQIGEDVMSGNNRNKKHIVYQEFFKSVKEAELLFKMTHIENIKNAADNGQWQASAWLLERCFRNEYGKNKVEMELTGKDGGAVETQATVQIYLPENGRDNKA